MLVRSVLRRHGVTLSANRTVSNQATASWTTPLNGSEHLYLCLCPDRSPSNRLNIRPKHLESSQKAHEAGVIDIVVHAGALLKEDQATGAAAQMNGSWLLIKATSMQEAKSKLLSDIYSKEGAWDVEKITVFPALMAH